ncbi:sulfotransferase family protein [Marinobacterium aestuariivivens]|uniref:Sulfotransferase family protein n=1 Tax=Marinobacterium aestuariivivens TaxID=1698799 RepID=A0ABW1ZYR2_9GAMM
MIGAHPDIAMINEPELIYALYRAGYLQQGLAGADPGEVIEQLGVVGLCRQHLEGLTPERVEKLRERRGDLSIRELYETLLPRPEAPIWGEKSLNNNFFVEALSRLYPEAVFVSVVRDPRSVLLSLAVKRKLVEEQADGLRIRQPVALARTLEIEGYKWALWNRVALDNARRVKPGRWLALRYEDLVEDPETGMRALCRSLEMEFDPMMLSSQARKNDPVLSTASRGAHARLSGELDRSRISAYRKWPAWALAIIEHHCGEAMVAFDYPPVTPGRSLAGAWARLSVPVFGAFNRRKKRKFRRQRGL